LADGTAAGKIEVMGRVVGVEHRAGGRAGRDDVHAGRGDVGVVQPVAGNAARGEVGEDRRAILTGRVVAGDGRVGRVGAYQLAFGRHADRPRRHAVRMGVVLVGRLFA